LNRFSRQCRKVLCTFQALDAKEGTLAGVTPADQLTSTNSTKFVSHKKNKNFTDSIEGKIVTSMTLKLKSNKSDGS